MEGLGEDDDDDDDDWEEDSMGMGCRRSLRVERERWECDRSKILQPDGSFG